MLAIDDDKAIEKFRLVDAIADTVGGEVAAKLIAKVKQSGSFGYPSVLPESAAAENPAVKITRVFTKPDPSKVREFADDVRDGKFILPIGRRMPLRDAAEAHVQGEKGGIGRSFCWRRIHNTDFFTADPVELRSTRPPRPPASCEDRPGGIRWRRCDNKHFRKIIAPPTLAVVIFAVVIFRAKLHQFFNDMLHL